MGIRDITRRVKRDLFALYFALRHEDTPWYALAWVAFVVGYALSPIDLIPDFIPVIGLLDDLILLPLGIGVAVWLLPDHVLTECRHRASTEESVNSPLGWIGIGLVLLIWLGIAGVAGWLIATG